MSGERGAAAGVLTERERRSLDRLRARQTPTLVIGAVLALAGGLYGVWGTAELKASTPPPGEAPALSRPAFDRPIVRLGELFRPQLERLSRITPATDREARLVAELRRQTSFLAALLVALARFFLALSALTLGLLLLTAALAQRPLLGMIRKLDAGSRMG